MGGERGGGKENQKISMREWIDYSLLLYPFFSFMEALFSPLFWNLGEKNSKTLFKKSHCCVRIWFALKNVQVGGPVGNLLI